MALTLTSLDCVSTLIFQLGKHRTLFLMQQTTAKPTALKHDCCNDSHLGGIGVPALESLPASDLAVDHLSHLI